MAFAFRSDLLEAQEPGPRNGLQPVPDLRDVRVAACGEGSGEEVVDDLMEGGEG